MNNHPTFVRCQAAAAAAGSTAQTTRGIARFLRNHGTLQPPTKSMQPATWKADQESRKADPDAKRARTDRAFRRRFLARLTRREKSAIACDGTITGVMAHYHSAAIVHRANELAECARLRTIVIGRPCQPLTQPVLGYRVRIDESTARANGAHVIMRGRDARIISSRSPSRHEHVAGETEWKRGRAVGYTRAKNDNYVRSIAVIRDQSTVDYVCHATRYTIVLPAGFRWDSDGHGLRAVMADSPADDFHPDASDLVSHHVVTIQSRLIENRDRRLLHAAAHAADAAQAAGVWVCLADSVRAGNCRQGTIAFAAQHGLDIARHYSAPELLARANGDVGRVRLAITAARLRHDREAAQGFCTLADHMA